MQSVGANPSSNLGKLSLTVTIAEVLQNEDNYQRITAYVSFQSAAPFSDLEEVPSGIVEGHCTETSLGNNSDDADKAIVEELLDLIVSLTGAVDVDDHTKTKLIERLVDLFRQSFVGLPGLVNLDGSVLVINESEEVVGNVLPMLEEGEVSGEHVPDVLLDIGGSENVVCLDCSLDDSESRLVDVEAEGNGGGSIHGSDDDDPDLVVSLHSHDAGAAFSHVGIECALHHARLLDDVAVDKDVNAIGAQGDDTRMVKLAPVQVFHNVVLTHRPESELGSGNAETEGRASD